MGHSGRRTEGTGRVEHARTKGPTAVRILPGSIRASAVGLPHAMHFPSTQSALAFTYVLTGTETYWGDSSYH